MTLTSRERSMLDSKYVIGIGLIKALVYTAVINGVVAVPILIAIMRIANDKRILKDRINGRIPNIIGWTTVLVLDVSVVVVFATWGSH